MSYKYIADIILEAKTAFSIGSGKNDETQDAPAQRDWNDMPIIFGTTTAGALKHLYSENDIDDIFGIGDEKEKDGNESRLTISSALLLYKEEDTEKDKVKEEATDKLPAFFEHYKRLPIRQHTAINDKGTAVPTSKHDQEVVYAGSRFKLRIELSSDTNDDVSKKKFESILELFYDERFRIGSKTTAGLGNLKPIDREIRYECFDTIEYDYYALSSSLNQSAHIFKQTYIYTSSTSLPTGYEDYSLHLSPESFFMFGSGLGSQDDSVDQIFLVEKKIDYENQTLSDNMLLIPASSIKGPLSHRTAFHHNRFLGITADDTTRFPTIEDFQKVLGENNEAVRAIFGAKSHIVNGEETGSKGNIIIDDCYIEVYDQKVFDHIKIDDFTGAVVKGALFNELVASVKSFRMHILINESKLNKETIKAFQDSIADLNEGRLSLGGMSGRGYGVFINSATKEVHNV